MYSDPKKDGNRWKPIVHYEENIIYTYLYHPILLEDLVRAGELCQHCLGTRGRRKGSTVAGG